MTPQNFEAGIGLAGLINQTPLAHLICLEIQNGILSVLTARRFDSSVRDSAVLY